MLKYEIPQRIVEAYCDLPWTKLICNGWGDISQCCYQLEQLGSILPCAEYPNGRDILEIWNSPKAQEIRQATLDNKLHRVCKSWNTCPFQVQELRKRPFTVQPKYPSYLEICLPNTHCNIGGETPSDENPACIMCCRNYDFVPQPQITEYLCEKTKSLIPYLNRLCVLGIAEPFWKDAVFRVFELIDFSRFKHKIKFETNTNGVCLTKRTVERFFAEVDYSEISFSLDAASAETYIKIRRVDCYEMVIENMRYYLEQRKQFGGAAKHKATVYNNINLINVHEMSMMVETAAQCGADQIIMIPTHDQCGRVVMGELLLNARNVKSFKRYAEEAQATAQRLGIYLFYPKPFDVVSPTLVQLQI